MQTTLRIECKNPELIKKSLEPDIKNKKDLRVDLSLNKNNLIIKVESKKISYLKAAINSYLSLVEMLRKLED